MAAQGGWVDTRPRSLRPCPGPASGFWRGGQGLGHRRLSGARRARLPRGIARRRGSRASSSHPRRSGPEAAAERKENHSSRGGGEEAGEPPPPSARCMNDLAAPKAGPGPAAGESASRAPGDPASLRGLALPPTRPGPLCPPGTGSRAGVRGGAHGALRVSAGSPPPHPNRLPQGPGGRLQSRTLRDRCEGRAGGRQRWPVFPGLDRHRLGLGCDLSKTQPGGLQAPEQGPGGGAPGPAEGSSPGPSLPADPQPCRRDPAWADPAEPTRPGVCQAAPPPALLSRDPRAFAGRAEPSSRDRERGDLGSSPARGAQEGLLDTGGESWGLARPDRDWDGDPQHSGAESAPPPAPGQRPVLSPCRQVAPGPGGNSDPEPGENLMRPPGALQGALPSDPGPDEVSTVPQGLPLPRSQLRGPET